MSAVTNDHTSGEHYIEGDWHPISTAEQFQGMTAGNNYYLTSKITLDGAWSVPEGEINLCLNGYFIEQDDENAHVIEIPSGATLNLYDCGEYMHYYNKDENGLWILDDTFTTSPYSITGGALTEIDNDKAGCVYINGGTFNMHGGNIVGNLAEETGFDSGYGGGVHMIYGEFNMYGGTIAGNVAYSGGGVDIDGGIFTMHNGNIIGNTVDAWGGGVDVNGGTFIMIDGTIEGNEVCEGNTPNGFGAGVYVSDEGTFIMKGGNIIGNIATAPHGSGGGVSNYGTFTMEGGNIKDNRVTNDGGGVYSYTASFTMTGGKITENFAAQEGRGVYLYMNNFIVSGDVIIAENTINDATDNVYLLNNQKIQFGAGGLGSNANIGINTQNSPTESISIDITNTGVSG